MLRRLVNNLEARRNDYWSDGEAFWYTPARAHGSRGQFLDLVGSVPGTIGNVAEDLLATRNAIRPFSPLAYRIAQKAAPEDKAAFSHANRREEYAQ